MAKTQIFSIDIDRVARESGSKPPGWDDCANYGPLNQAMDQYRQHLAHTYFNYKYRCFEAAQRLETIAEETRLMCQKMWDQPLRATAFSYAARTTPITDL
ncbi:MAG: hypothetical protein ABI411_07250 [Tahibacter sp.]